MTFKNLLNTLLVCTVLGGCALPSSVKYNIAEPGSSHTQMLTVRDQRSPSQKQFENMSTDILGCWYGVYRLGDEQIVPDRLLYLTSGLTERVRSAIRSQTVTIHRFEIYNNAQRRLRPKSRVYAEKANPGTTTPPSSVLATLTESACDVQLEGVSNQENPDNLPSTVIYYDLTINGKRIAGHVVQGSRRRRRSFRY
jgi:hypothetical protein